MSARGKTPTAAESNGVNIHHCDTFLNLLKNLERDLFLFCLKLPKSFT